MTLPHIPLEDQKARFLAELSEVGSYAAAARKVGVRRETAWKWRSADEAFKTACEEARTEAYEYLEDSMYQRAIKHDTIAGIFLMKGENPEKYRDNAKITVGGAILHAHLGLADMTAEDRAAILQLAARKTLTAGE